MSDIPTGVSTVFTRGQTVIPKLLRERFHIHEGDLIQWKASERGLLVVRLEVRSPAEDFSQEEWDKLDRLAARQRRRKQGTPYEDLEEAKQHSRRLMSRPRR